ncbi:hypothetical protein CWS35_14355 [Bradyrhizobium sp. SK17]|nr:hypothetical protein CWS35_14355 [Bradyrhizobium sp. SK17]
MAAGFQHDDIAWFQFHDFPSAHDDAGGTLATGDDSQITAGGGIDGIDVENSRDACLGMIFSDNELPRFRIMLYCAAGTSSVSERMMRSGLMVDPGGSPTPCTSIQIA